MQTRCLLAVLALFAAPAAHAQSDLSDFGIGAGISTLGFTVEPSLRINDRWGLRAPLGAGSISFDDDSNGQEYSGDLDLGGVGLLADFYPFAASGFRISAGVFYSDYSADLTGDAIEIGSFNSDVTARIRQREDIAPAFAVGYNGAITERTSLSLTVGGIFGDGFDVDAQADNPLIPQALVDAEVEDIRDDLGDLDVIPFVQLSVAWRF